MDRHLHGWWAAAASLVSTMALVGCGGEETADVATPVTWHQDVAPIVAKHCGSCHVEGGIAPFPLDSYDAAQSTAGLMLEAVESGIMPPWGARDTDECHPELGYKGDLRLSDDERKTLQKWVDDGTLEGDPKAAATLPEPPVLTISDPSLELPFPGDYTIDGTTDDFQCFVLDPGVTSKKWITQIQLSAGNPLIDHHGLVFLDFKGESEALAKDGRFPCFTNPDVAAYLLATWTPGAAPVIVPEGAGMPVYPGSRIVVQMHYHPTGKGPEKDPSSVQLKWVDTEPQYEAAQALVGNFDEQGSNGSGLQPGPNDAGGTPQFFIPAGKSDHTETMIYRQDVPLSFPVYSVGTHMHYVGSDMKIELKHKSEDTTQCLLQTPEWDFNWQRVYDLDAAVDDLPRISPGDELHMRCTYNNTLDNRFVARALKEQGLTQPKDVLLGEQTLDEMCLGIFGILVPPGLLEELFQ